MELELERLVDCDCFKLWAMRARNVSSARLQKRSMCKMKKPETGMLMLLPLSAAMCCLQRCWRVRGPPAAKLHAHPGRPLGFACLRSTGNPFARSVSLPVIHRRCILLCCSPGLRIRQ